MRETAQIRGYPFQLPRTLIHLLPYWVSIPASPQRHPIVLQTWTIEYSCLYQPGPVCFPFCSQTTACSTFPKSRGNFHRDYPTFATDILRSNSYLLLQNQWRTCQLWIDDCLKSSALYRKQIGAKQCDWILILPSEIHARWGPIQSDCRYSHTRGKLLSLHGHWQNRAVNPSS